eukprot:gene5914-7363_t
MTSVTSQVSAGITQQLKRKIFRHIPHNILKPYPEYILKSLPEHFIKSLPTAPAGVIKLTLIKSSSHTTPDVKGTLKALGLYKMHHYMYHKNTPEIRGMIHKARRHLSVEEIPLE